VEIFAMIDFDPFERRLAAALRSDADLSVPPFDPASIARAATQIEHARQRRAVRVPRRIATMNLYARLAAAAIVVIAVGGAFYLLRPSQPTVGTPSSTPNASSSPTESVVPSPSAAARAPSWTAAGSMGTPRRGQSATLLVDGRVLVVGGEPNGPKPPSAELYDPTTGSWTDAGRTLGYSGTHLTRLLDGRVLAGTSELYDPGTGAWTATGRPVAAHVDGETTTRLLDGRLLVAGGHADTPKGVTGSAELYDPQTGRWTVTGSMVTPRAGHTATLLPDGKVLVAGGGDYGDDWTMASAELYDPVSGTWTATGTMLAKIGPRNSSSNQVATLLRDGRVLVAGFVVLDCAIDGSGPCSFVSHVELYDPGSGTWTATGTMADAREGFTATLLPDGMVLVAGGVRLVSGSISDVNLASADLYDPGTGAWTAAAGMAVARDGHTATLLLDGKVLVAGGGSNMLATDQASAELYDPGSP
jgi:Galactose oxidase, central domain/Kelch motif